MAAPTTCTYGGLNLNDGTTYTLVGDSVDLGERIKTWSEYPAFDGTVAQYNVSEANLIEMHLQIRVEGASNAALTNAIAAINDKIDAGAQSLVWNDGGGAVTYSCVHSPRVRNPRGINAQIGYWTVVDLVLYRTP